MREQGVALEHRVHRPLVWRGPGLVDPVDEDGAAVRPLEPGNQAQCRGFAASRRPEQRKNSPSSIRRSM